MNQDIKRRLKHAARQTIVDVLKFILFFAVSLIVMGGAIAITIYCSPAVIISTIAVMCVAFVFVFNYSWS